jgi:hypothetical protein
LMSVTEYCWAEARLRPPSRVRVQPAMQDALYWSPLCTVTALYCHLSVLVTGPPPPPPHLAQDPRDESHVAPDGQRARTRKLSRLLDSDSVRPAPPRGLYRAGAAGAHPTQVYRAFFTATPPAAVHCTALHCTALCRAVPLSCTLNPAAVSHSTAPVSPVPRATALHCTALHCTTLHCTALHAPPPAAADFFYPHCCSEYMTAFQVLYGSVCLYLRN